MPCEFESASPIIDGLGKFVKNGKTGYIDATGNFVIDGSDVVQFKGY